MSDFKKFVHNRLGALNDLITKGPNIELDPQMPELEKTDTEDEKKACFKDLDDAHVADHEEQVQKESENENSETGSKKQEYLEEDEFNPSLAAMEEEIRPQVIQTINLLAKNYYKLIKYQEEKLNYTLKAKEFSRAKESGYKKIQGELVEKIKSLQLNPSILEELVQIHYVENRKIISL